jgi:hypothetical protein
MIDIPVLISGGGTVGGPARGFAPARRALAACRAASEHRDHAESARVNARTMEVFRQCGIDTAIRDAGLPEGRMGLIV